MTIHMIWATSDDRFIGKDNMLPWYVPEDLAHFKELTTGKTVVMGRKTWESLNYQPLPWRKNIVLSSQYGYRYKFPASSDLLVYSSIHSLMTSHKDFWVIGGTNVFTSFMPYADHLVKTHVDVKVFGDAKAPTFFPSEWRKVVDNGWKTSVSGLNYNITEYIRNT